MTQEMFSLNRWRQPVRTARPPWQLSVIQTAEVMAPALSSPASMSASARATSDHRQWYQSTCDESVIEEQQAQTDPWPLYIFLLRQNSNAPELLSGDQTVSEAVKDSDNLSSTNQAPMFIKSPVRTEPPDGYHPF